MANLEPRSVELRSGYIYLMLDGGWTPANRLDAVLCAILWGVIEEGDMPIRRLVTEVQGQHIELADPVKACNAALHELLSRGHIEVCRPASSMDWRDFEPAARAEAAALIDSPEWWVPYDELPDDHVGNVHVWPTTIGEQWGVEHCSFGLQSWLGVGNDALRETIDAQVARMGTIELEDGRLPWQ